MRHLNEGHGAMRSRFEKPHNYTYKRTTKCQHEREATLVVFTLSFTFLDLLTSPQDHTYPAWSDGNDSDTIATSLCAAAPGGDFCSAISSLPYHLRSTSSRRSYAILHPFKIDIQSRYSLTFSQTYHHEQQLSKGFTWPGKQERPRAPGFNSFRTPHFGDDQS